MVRALIQGILAQRDMEVKQINPYCQCVGATLLLVIGAVLGFYRFPSHPVFVSSARNVLQRQQTVTHSRKHLCSIIML